MIIGDSVTTITLLFVTGFILTLTIVVIVLYNIQNYKNKKYKKLLDKLEVEKNIIDSMPIVPELSKVETFINNEKLEAMYNEWKSRLDGIKKEQIPKLTDMLIDTEYSLSQMDYKTTLYKISKLEMELYKVRTNSNFLLSEIKEITLSEEKNRNIITEMKKKYRELRQKFENNKESYDFVADSIKLQFENISNTFEAFEQSMEENDFLETTKIISSIQEMVSHMEVVIDEVPTIITTATTILPKRIKEINEIYTQMKKEKYPLEYLNVEYNIEEANNKISDILERAKLLNLEDSLFELKVLVDYFDTLFNDFEREKIEKNNYLDANNSFKKKLDRTNELVDGIFSELDQITEQYNLTEDNIKSLNDIASDLKELNADYKILVEHMHDNTFAYSKLTKEIEILSINLSNLEERLDSNINVLGSMKEDEKRAHEQLDEVKQILKEAKAKIREYNLPVIPKTYYIELKEAQEAIKEIIKELDKKPIDIEILNTRVDTARDLSLKLYSKTKEMLKTAMFAEMAIVYGNRYRSNIEGLDKNLTVSENLFNNGDYKKSLEVSINSLNRVEKGIYDKLLSLYNK